MAELSIRLPHELEKSMHEFRIDWVGVARRAIFDRAVKLKKLKEFSSKVKVSDKLAKEFTDKISESVAKRFREEK